VTPSAARRLARFVVAFGLGDLPRAVAEKAELLTLDTLGCCLAAARYDFAQAARDGGASGRTAREHARR
jgi:2-methylcitrate dehydratase PrpD